MGFARLLRNLLRGQGHRRAGRADHPRRGPHLRHGRRCSRRSKIYAPFGQKYEPVDAELLLVLPECQEGQILEEGITEAGSMAQLHRRRHGLRHLGPADGARSTSSIRCSASSGSGDLIWAFGDMRGRGFLLGATAGRTTLNGEGLQHQDGHSLRAGVDRPERRRLRPRLRLRGGRRSSQDGIRRMYGDVPEDVFYYLTLYNENYAMPADAGGRRRGHRCAASTGSPRRPRGRAGGPRSCSAAAPSGPPSRRSSCWPRTTTWPPSCGAPRPTRRCARTPWRPSGGTACTRPSRRARRTSPRRSADTDGPVVAVTDFMKAVPDQVARWVPAPLHRRSAPTATAAPTPGRRCAATSRSTPPTSSSPCCTRWPTGEAKAEEVAEAIATLRHRPRGHRPPPGLAEPPDHRNDSTPSSSGGPAVCVRAMASKLKLPFSGDEEADRLLEDDPLALLIGMVLDQQIPLEKAFSAPASSRSAWAAGRST